jgi:hypothetical protein
VGHKIQFLFFFCEILSKKLKKMENYHQQYDNGGESYPKRDKKKGRRGNFDSSRDIDKDNYEYFQRVMENLETQEFEDEEEKGNF